MCRFLNFASVALAIARSAIAVDEKPAAIGPPSCSNPLAWGFYAQSEVQQPNTLEVQGTIPLWLRGSLYRGAAGTWDVGNFTTEHWFDGFSRNHVFEIADGVVTYHSRNGSDELLDFVRETGLYPNGAFGLDPCKIIFGAFEQTWRDWTSKRGDASTDNIGVSFIKNFPGLNRNHSGDAGPIDTLVVTTDANSLQQINPITLEPIELFTYEASHPLLNNSGRTAAHPAILGDGAIYNYVLDLSAQPPAYHIFGITPPDGETKILATIDDAPPAYLHSIFNTANHIILIVWQADFTQSGKTLISSMGPWNEDRPVLFYVIDRFKGGLVSKYAIQQSFFAFHQVNSFEDENGDIIIDLPRMDDLSFINSAHVENIRANLGNKKNSSSFADLSAEFTRYRLPNYGNGARSKNGTLITHRAEIEWTIPFSKASIELPRMNEAYSGKPYQYAWGVHTEDVGYFVDSLIKIDVHTQEWKIWKPETPHFPSEPIFVPTPDAECEDDGVILTVAMDAVARVSMLVVLDAATMEEIARARMPVVMGYGFHGTWAEIA